MTTITIQQDIKLSATEFSTIEELYQTLTKAINPVALYATELEKLSNESKKKIKQSIKKGLNELENFQGYYANY